MTIQELLTKILETPQQELKLCNKTFERECTQKQ